MTDPKLEPFKIQRPLAGNMGEALAYNRDRSVTTFLPMTRALRRVFREQGNPPKLYAQARLHANGTFELDEIVEAQPW